MSNYQQLFDESYDRVVGRGIGITAKGEKFFRRFYTHFFQCSDEIRQKFKDTDIDAQARILQKSMYHMISFYVLNADHDFLHKIAISHARSQYDIKPQYYDHWMEALILTVEELDSQFDREIDLAWRLALTPGILYMKMHYEDESQPT